MLFKIQLFIIFLKANDEGVIYFVISESEASIFDAVKSAAPVRKSLSKMPREANSSTLFSYFWVNLVRNSSRATLTASTISNMFDIMLTQSSKFVRTQEEAA